MTQIKRADDAVRWLTSRPADGVSLIFGAMARLRRAPAVHCESTRRTPPDRPTSCSPALEMDDGPAGVQDLSGTGVERTMAHSLPTNQPAAGHG